MTGAFAVVSAWLAALSVRDMAEALAIVVVVVMAVCWVLTNEGRSQRLALIIDAWRGHCGSQAARALPEATSAGRAPVDSEVGR